jgi:hypothetical protein
VLARSDAPAGDADRAILAALVTAWRRLRRDKDLPALTTIDQLRAFMASDEEVAPPSRNEHLKVRGRRSGEAGVPGRLGAATCADRPRWRSGPTKPPSTAGSGSAVAAGARPLPSWATVVLDPAHRERLGRLLAEIAAS